MKRYFLAAMLAVLPCLSQADWSGEIAGVTLGMSAEQARAAVMKVNARFQLEDKKATDGTPWGFVALDVTGDDKRWGADYVVVSLENGKVWYVGRRQIFPEGGRPTVKSFFEAIEQRYGKFNVFMDSGREKYYQELKTSGLLRGSSYGGIWWFDRAGKPDERACAAKEFEFLTEVPRHSRFGIDPFMQKVYARLANVNGTAFGLPNKASGSCGRRAQFYATPGQDSHDSGRPEFIGSVTVWAADMSVKFDRVMAQQAAVENAKKQALAAEQAKAIKPSF